jgi:6-phosphofructokinase
MQVKAHFGKIKMSVDVKYIDPTYMIRARPCNSADHIFCSVLGQNAVRHSHSRADSNSRPLNMTSWIKMTFEL